ncbi:MAG: hypothetical protein PVI30_13880 [Myxococcales bacterium]
MRKLVGGLVNRRIYALAMLFVLALGMTLWTSPGLGQDAAQGTDPGTTEEGQPPLADGDGVLAGGLLELTFTPVEYAQIAIWIERDGELLSTVRLTESVALRGVGNRPGASQMNSGFRWPYGRREGVLPVWATRRASAPGAEQFRRVIFQDRSSEGRASRTSDDFSRDDYYCLSFDRTRSSKDALDAVSCASIFNSDKGRFITEQDVERGYSEPYEDLATGEGRARALSLYSLYPPRRDVTPCLQAGCFDHEDVADYASHAREVMPEIDAVTMATPVGGAPQKILYQVPHDWEAGDYRVCLEINVEGDYNETYNDEVYPMPTTPEGTWDTWAMTYGYAYRGQPSVVYCVDAAIGGDEMVAFDTAEPAGTTGSWDLESEEFGTLRPMDGMTDDPVAAPGSGADRLQLMEDGYRLRVSVQPPVTCDGDAPPGAIEELSLGEHSNELHAHQWATLRFRAADDDRGVYRYDVRYSTQPIVDEESFMAATPAKQATLEAEELTVPTDAPAGDMVSAEMGGLTQSTHYYVGVRAMDACAGTGPIAVAEITTPERAFATVTPCFVATAAWGTPLADEIGALRRFRDRHMLTNPVGRALVSAYYSVGPDLADLIRDHDGLRAVARTALSPLVAFARWLER